jgi:hypothetical protein
MDNAVSGRNWPETLRVAQPGAGQIQRSRQIWHFARGKDLIDQYRIVCRANEQSHLPADAVNLPLHQKGEVARGLISNTWNLTLDEPAFTIRIESIPGSSQTWRVVEHVGVKSSDIGEVDPMRTDSAQMLKIV